VKLLFDQNLSPRLVELLQDAFPDSVHVQAIGMELSLDIDLWQWAISHECTIVSKDEDFSQLSTLLGSPPKVVWLRLGNCTTQMIESKLRQHIDEIEDFISNADSGVMVIE